MGAVQPKRALEGRCGVRILWLKGPTGLPLRFHPAVLALGAAGAIFDVLVKPWDEPSQVNKLWLAVLKQLSLACVLLVRCRSRHVSTHHRIRAFY
jgi:hypothetical protein